MLLGQRKGIPLDHVKCVIRLDVQEGIEIEMLGVGIIALRRMNANRMQVRASGIE